jgi:hypothetical protein
VFIAITYLQGEESMKRFAVIILSCLALITLNGCIQVETMVKVKPDGSGVIEETFLMKKDFVSQMKKMMEEMAEGMNQMMTEGENGGETPQAHPPAPTFEIFDEAKLKDKAGDKGEGVTYLEGSKIMTDDYEGYRAVYAFKDINTIRINQNPGEKVPSGPQPAGPDENGAKKEYVVFVFTGGSPAELIIKSPGRTVDREPGDVPEDKTPAPENEKASDSMMAQMKEMFRGMKIAFTVEVEGDIVETNATHREGSKVTVVELDFGKLIEMPEQFRQFSQAKPETVEESKLLMQKIPGMKVDLNDEIRIRFR